MTTDVHNPPSIDPVVYDKVVDLLGDVFCGKGELLKIEIARTDDERGWIGTASKKTEEGGTGRQIVAIPLGENVWECDWRIEVSWSSRDCDGLYDGGYELLAQRDLSAVDGVSFTRQSELPTRDHSAEAAGY